MPFIRTSVHKDTPASRRQAMVDGIDMSADELFNLVTDYDAQQFFYSRTFNGIARSDRMVLIEITMRRGRSDAMKRALYASWPATWKKRRCHPQRRVYLHA